MTGWRLCLASMIASVALPVGSHGVSAEVQVDGRPEAVHLEARDASLREVLAALHDRFNLSVRMTRWNRRRPASSTVRCCASPRAFSLVTTMR